ncbi:MAG: alanine--tRNA ligase-related protein, partial [Alphaproteobacteria bacterium]|nr:alanine--tRNA ligase-related protein [Alphaproteobacteria bacterium]
WYKIKEKTGTTDFLGYETERAEGLIAALIKNGKEVSSLGKGERGVVILYQTPFYGESGGQVGDTGLMQGGGVRFRVVNTQKKLGTLFVHEGVVEEGELTVGLALELIVDHDRRQAVRTSHSATHLLHEALRRVLGEHVAQKGSLVAPGRLRFDFTHPKQLTPDEFTRVEDMANRIILENSPVVTRQMEIDEAIETGARALFGEKYGDEVRVVSMGFPALDEPPQGEAAELAFSTELCGGTHVSRTGDIGLLTLISDSPVAAGVRRIEARTADEARHYLNARAHHLRDLAALLKTPEDEADKRLAGLIEDNKKLERELSEARRKLALGAGAGSQGQPVQEIGGVKFLGRVVRGIAMKDLKSLADEAKASVGSGVIAIVGVGEDGKAGVVVGVTPDLTQRFDAVQLVRPAALQLGGKNGGGRRDLAQAGGPQSSAAEAALAAVGEALRDIASAA